MAVDVKQAYASPINDMVTDPKGRCQLINKKNGTTMYRNPVDAHEIVSNSNDWIIQSRSNPYVFVEEKPVEPEAKPEQPIGEAAASIASSVTNDANVKARSGAVRNAAK